MWPFKRRRAQVYVPPRQSPRAPSARATLQRVPGPSPWYLERPGTEIERASGQLRWRSAGNAPLAAGKSLLQTNAGETVAVTDFQCYVQPLSRHRVLVWYAAEAGEGAAVRRTIQFRIVRSDELRPIRDLPNAFARLGKASRFYAEAGDVANVAVSTALSDGAHRVALPEEFKDIGELLVLAHSTSEGRAENHFDTMHLRLWILDTAAGRLKIVPQDWFNLGPYDFGYQWVTRMARLPDTGDIVGEGIRLGLFRLDPSLRAVAEWLQEDMFFMPTGGRVQ
jgi:hypothetical protein